MMKCYHWCFSANDNERMHRLIEENVQWRNRAEDLEQRLQDLSSVDSEVDADRHRLQISVLQERLKEQEDRNTELQLQATHSTTGQAAKAAIAQLHSQNVTLKMQSQRLQVIGPKIMEHIQRLQKYVVSIDQLSFVT